MWLYKEPYTPYLKSISGSNFPMGILALHLISVLFGFSAPFQTLVDFPILDFKLSYASNLFSYILYV